MAEGSSSSRKGPNNAVAEWFGHRVYPTVAATPAALDDQRASRCPFLTTATGTDHVCVKPKAALGICTISSTSNGPRQDWLVCPFRSLDSRLLDDVARRLFEVPKEQGVAIRPATTLVREEVREWNPELLERPQLVVATKRDAVDPAADPLPRLVEAARAFGLDVLPVSAVTGERLVDLKRRLLAHVDAARPELAVERPA